MRGLGTDFVRLPRLPVFPNSVVSEIYVVHLEISQGRIISLIALKGLVW